MKDPSVRAKQKARWIAYQDIKIGKIEKQPCIVCGDPNSQTHHDDYSKPRKVIFVCRKHHDEIHAAVI